MKTKRTKEHPTRLMKYLQCIPFLFVNIQFNLTWYSKVSVIPVFVIPIFNLFEIPVEHTAHAVLFTSPVARLSVKDSNKNELPTKSNTISSQLPPLTSTLCQRTYKFNTKHHKNFMVVYIFGFSRSNRTLFDCLFSWHIHTTMQKELWNIIAIRLFTKTISGKCIPYEN